MENGNYMKLDAGEVAFFSRQLEYIKPRTYDKKYKEFKAFMLFPISTDTPSGSERITYRVFTKIGTAKIISDYANDFPRADIIGEEKTAKVKGVGSSYGYSIPEIRRAALAGFALDQKRADSAKQSSDQKVNTIAFNGDAKFGLQGFLNYPGITEYIVPADGTGNKRQWEYKTPDQIVRDMSDMVGSVVDTTNGIEVPDSVLLPVSRYNILVSKRMTDGNNKNILSYILENNPYIKNIEWVTELKGIGQDFGADGSRDRMMAYKKDPEKLTLEIPQPFEQFDPDKRNMEYVIPCHQETGGVIIYYPQSVIYGDGI